jgi:integrase
MSSIHPTGFVRIEVRAKGSVAYSQIRCEGLCSEPDCNGKQHVEAIGRVHVEQRGGNRRGKWQPIRSRPPEGVMTLAEAQVVLDERIRALSGVPDASKGLTFGQAVTDWLDHIENVEQRRHSTVRDYKSLAKNHLLPEFGADTPLSDIDFKRCDAFRSRLLRDGKLSKRMVQKALILLGSIFKTAQRLHGFPSNPAALVKKGSVPRGEVSFWTHEQVATLCQHAGDDADLYFVMSRIGLRRGEMVALRKQDVDFKHGKVNVRVNYVDGIETTPKDHEIRSVPLPPSVAEVLLGVCAMNDYELVFPRWDGAHQNPDSLSKRFTQAKQDAGFGDHPGTLENLRHTFATYAGDRFPAPKVQRWLGHSDLATTMRYIGVLDSTDDAAAMDEHAASML